MMRSCLWSVFLVFKIFLNRNKFQSTISSHLKCSRSRLKCWIVKIEVETYIFFPILSSRFLTLLLFYKAPPFNLLGPRERRGLEITLQKRIFRSVSWTCYSLNWNPIGARSTFTIHPWEWYWKSLSAYCYSEHLFLFLCLVRYFFLFSTPFPESRWF